MGIQSNSASADQLHFQTQLLERLHNISPFQPQRSPYNTPSPYAMGPNLLLPPCSGPTVSNLAFTVEDLTILWSINKTINVNLCLFLAHGSATFQNTAQLSPSSASLRVSQANSFSSSPVMAHKLDNYGTDNVDAQHPAFIRPLPCTNADRNVTHSLADVKIKQERTNPQDDIPPIILDPPPQGKRSDNSTAKKAIPSSVAQGSAQDSRSNVSNTKNLATILRSTGPPPSRTTSARLPSRSELMSEVQRTTWARHTTKWLSAVRSYKFMPAQPSALINKANISLEFGIEKKNCPAYISR